MILIDERTHKSEVFKYEKGLEAFIEYINDGKETLHPVINIEGTETRLK